MYYVYIFCELHIYCLCYVVLLYLRVLRWLLHPRYRRYAKHESNGFSKNVVNQSTRHRIPEDFNINIHHLEDLTSRID
jgi:hypothetical protein